MSKEFYRQAHVAFLRRHIDLAMDGRTSTFELWFIGHKKLSAAYWTVGALFLLGAEERIPREALIEWVLQCQHESGGFGGDVRQDPHLLFTLSAVQILAMLDALHRIDRDRIARYVASLQRKDGSFCGDAWGEVDTRFSYAAALCLSILRGASESGVAGGCAAPLASLPHVDVAAMVDFVMRCENFDGGFGLVPGAESHAGQIFCCVGTLALCGALHRLRDGGDALGLWLAARQMHSGGFNGRPDKLHDVCYSWWVFSALAMIGRTHWVDAAALEQFILSCQDELLLRAHPASSSSDSAPGGIADRPGDQPDVFHTFFGITGLALIRKHGIGPIDPAYALPMSVVQRLRESNVQNKESD